jgi:hypothetical protein
MKLFEFWFELPQALVNIADDIISKEEKEYSRVLSSSFQVK